MTPPLTAPGQAAVAELERIAARLRCDIIRMVHQAGEGHPGGSLSATDIVTALYFRVMRLDPARPDWPDRDRFILSKGHACPLWYSALMARGYLGAEHLGSLRCLDSILQGHPDMCKTPGIDMTAGSLGHGLSAGLGMALAGRVHRKDYCVWVVIGDGETQEGAIWEAAMGAAGFGVGNLTAILDRNRIQNDDFVDRIMPIEPVADKWRAFGWEVSEIDGHDMAQVVEALEASRQVADRPSMIIAHTVKGKGVSYMENNPAWHGRAPNRQEAEQALREICESAGLEVQHVD
ncbi:MAG: transketolase [Chloroflexi bacterium]|nr:transketolase [Chloroflexota bacterium]